ncbi:MAG: hypothetical protein ACRDPM_18865, partial [Solirubrobacteraceae bacterium]
MTPETAVPARSADDPIEARTPSAGEGTGEPGSGAVTRGPHPSGHGMAMPAMCNVGPVTTAGAGGTGSGAIRTAATGASRTGTTGGAPMGVTGGDELIPARAADSATGRFGS